jgi:hypothetical protein
MLRGVALSGELPGTAVKDVDAFGQGGDGEQDRAAGIPRGAECAHELALGQAIGSHSGEAHLMIPPVAAR